MRSAFIRICNSWPEINKKFIAIEERYGGKFEQIKEARLNILRSCYEYAVNVVRDRFPNRFQEIRLERDKEAKVLAILYYLYHFAHIFETTYVYRPIMKIYERGYPRLDVHIDAILKGETIQEHIPNPFLLIRELLRTFYIENRPVTLGSESVVSLIYSLWGSAEQHPVALAPKG